jgi:hypothetical protein
VAAVKINEFDTTCVRIDIVCDANNERGASSGAEVASILRELAEKFEAGKNPMSHNEAAVEGASVDYL